MEKNEYTIFNIRYISYDIIRKTKYYKIAGKYFVSNDFFSMLIYLDNNNIPDESLSIYVDNIKLNICMNTIDVLEEIENFEKKMKGFAKEQFYSVKVSRILPISTLYSRKYKEKSIDIPTLFFLYQIERFIEIEKVEFNLWHIYIYFKTKAFDEKGIISIKTSLLTEKEFNQDLLEVS